MAQLLEVKTALTALQEEINEAKEDMKKAKIQLEKAIEEGKPESILASLKSLYEGAVSNLTRLGQEKTELLKEKQMIFSTINNATELTTPRKRTRSASSGVSVKSNKSELTQDAFKKRVRSRDDNCCVFTRKGVMESDACHIVGKEFFQKNDFQQTIISDKIFDMAFPESCAIMEHRIMDVRNGILMWKPLHEAFDSYYFTIVKGDDCTYSVITLPTYLIDSDNKELQLEVEKLSNRKFSYSDEKKEQAPGEKFLKFHNYIFEKNKLRLQAKAEDMELEDEDSVQTIAMEIAESKEKIAFFETLSSQTYTLHIAAYSLE
ncbi:hypothetical protein HK103_005272 [Boothiomyces macroporosus]|uniref:HNH nuclease domain-containing protein n=1 Tax=Boothiomyces macroporosus TaxID=261099 RepID=A0AAD5Y3F0_9FUNG|nr:hypothetical protein HK103_005252 [Boothiomyces macroporosus]KAJ3256638.1 hypothetical protein HK103_005272 [Boothiomyces macroporosus]